jgi:hypothetical protein
VTEPYAKANIQIRRYESSTDSHIVVAIVAIGDKAGNILHFLHLILNCLTGRRLETAFRLLPALEPAPEPALEVSVSAVTSCMQS